MYSRMFRPDVVHVESSTMNAVPAVRVRCASCISVVVFPQPPGPSRTMRPPCDSTRSICSSDSTSADPAPFGSTRTAARSIRGSQPITDSLAKYIHGRIAVRAVARPARGAGKPHGKAGCRLDTSRQRCRRADTRKRQGHRVRAAVARRQIRARVGLDGCQSNIGTALYKAHRGQARPGLRGSRSRSPRSPEGRDLPRDISGFDPRALDLRQAAAGKRGEHYCETTGSG